MIVRSRPSVALALAIFAVPALTASIVACSSSKSSTANPEFDEAGLVAVPNDDAGPFNPDATCAALPNVAPSIPFTFSSVAAPVGAGGALANGTYFLTADTLYTNDDAGVAASDLGTIASTLIVANGGIQIVTIGSTSGTTTNTATFSTAGTTLTLTDTCPDTRIDDFDYTATGTTLSLITSTDSSGEATVQTYTLQSAGPASDAGADASTDDDASTGSDDAAAGAVDGSDASDASDAAG